MAKTRSETIVLVGMPTRKEDKAIAAMSPGHVVVYSGAGIIKRATAKVDGPKAVVLEDELRGKTIVDAYAIGDNVYYAVFKPGECSQVRVAASATSIAKGAQLEFAADGTLRNRGAFSQSGTTPFAVTEAGIAVAIAMEALDNSAGVVEAFLTVEWL
jgi:hypothetical protein